MISKDFIDSITKQINKDEEISPCLFLWKNWEILHSNVENLTQEIAKIYQIPLSYIYILKDDGEKIKIADIKRFLEFSLSKAPYKVQFFIIENISRLTLQAANSCLKLFEEPWKQNVIFLTNSSESGVLDTILSRVKKIDMWWIAVSNKDDFYFSLIHNYLQNNNTEIFSYFFRNKLEKADCIKFLENLILYSKENFCFIDILTDIDEDINAIHQNNVSPKYIVDKYLLTIK